MHLVRDVVTVFSPNVGAPLKAIASLIDDPDHVVLTPQCHLFQTLLLGVHFLGEVELVWKLDLAGIFLMTAINS